MSGAPIVIDVVHPALRTPDAIDGAIAVVVEPLYAGVAVAAALDAGWESVELAPDGEGAAAIPLVSFEQAPPAGSRRCRVRSSDLHGAVQAGDLLGAPALARPLCARLASGDHRRITFLPVPAGDELGSDAWWACGMLVRVLLDELESAASLTDAAGLVVTLAQGAEDPFAQLAAGARWRRHLDRGGHPDDLRVAASVDSLAFVPQVSDDGGTPIATAWSS